MRFHIVFLMLCLMLLACGHDTPIDPGMRDDIEVRTENQEIDLKLFLGEYYCELEIKNKRSHNIWIHVTLEIKNDNESLGVWGALREIAVNENFVKEQFNVIDSSIKNRINSNSKCYLKEITPPLSNSEKDGFGGITDVSRLEKQKTIAEKLFNLSADLINYEYNDYRDCPPDFNCGLVRPPDCGKPCRWYRGGHAGWDVQTKSVAGDSRTANERFFSLTPGTVRDTSGTSGKIAIYYPEKKVTILYLHTRKHHIYVAPNTSVYGPDSVNHVGRILGIQGNVGLGYPATDTNSDEHVHIEVRRDTTTSAAVGSHNAGEIDSTIIDPVEFLYSVLVENEAVK